MVRLVFRPYTQIWRTICTSVPLRASIRVSPDFALRRHSSPSFGSSHTCSNSNFSLATTISTSLSWKMQRLSNPKVQCFHFGLQELVISRPVGGKTRVVCWTLHKRTYAETQGGLWLLLQDFIFIFTETTSSSFSSKESLWPIAGPGNPSRTVVQVCWQKIRHGWILIWKQNSFGLTVPLGVLLGRRGSEIKVLQVLQPSLSVLTPEAILCSHSSFYPFVCVPHTKAINQSGSKVYNGICSKMLTGSGNKVPVRRKGLQS